MVKIVYCGICGKMLQGIVRNCAYCGIPMCRHHNFNGLCPAHVHTMDGKQIREVNKQRSAQMWGIICTLAIGTFSLLFGILGLIFGNGYIFGIVNLGIFVIDVIIGMVIFRKAQSKKAEVYQEVDRQLDTKLVHICPKCGGPVPKDSQKCTICGLGFHQNQPITPQPTQLQQPLPPPPPAATHQQQSRPLPPPPPGYTGNTAIDETLQQLVDENPGSTLEVTSFYEEKSQSGFYVCKYCNKRFETDGTKSQCPFCHNSIYGNQASYR